MRRKLIFGLIIVFFTFILGAWLAIRLGGEYVAESVVLPRLRQKLEANLEWRSVRSSFGEVSVQGISVRFEDVPEIEIRTKELDVRYGIWSLLFGEVDVRQIVVNSPTILVSKLDHETLSRVRQRISKSTKRQSRGGATESQTRTLPHLKVLEGIIEVHNFAGTQMEIRGLNAAILFDGSIEARVRSIRVTDVSLGNELVKVGFSQITAQREAGRRININDASLTGLSLRFSIEEDPSRFRKIYQDYRNLIVSEPEKVSTPQRENNVARNISVRWPTSVQVLESQIELQMHSREQGEPRVIQLSNIDGNILLGNETEPPGVDVEGELNPGQGDFQIQANITEEGSPRVRMRVVDVSVGRLASGLSFSDLEFDESSILDADVALERREDGELAFAGELSVDGLSLSSELISREPVRDLRVRTQTRGEYSVEENLLQLDSARIWINGIESRISGYFSRREKRTVLDINGSLPNVSCSELKNAVPRAFRDNLDELDLLGQISGDVHLAFDTENLENLILDVDIRNRCEAMGRGNLAIERINSAFLHRVELPGDEIYEFRSGPGSGAWASFSQISPYIIAAVLTTEDGRFFYHNGFNLREIRRALIRDIRAGRPRFGASTISMQLARNLFLYRSRTLSRKIQEAILTWYLEENLTKDQILALYLNIIEYGPRIFGIRHAAMHYFGRQPDDLSPREAMFIAKLLPSPVSGHEATYEEGELSPRWRARVDRALRVMRNRGALTINEYNEAVKQRIVFYTPGDPLPLHRFWRPRGDFFRRRGVIGDDPPERWLEVDTEANLPAPFDLEDDFDAF